MRQLFARANIESLSEKFGGRTVLAEQVVVDSKSGTQWGTFAASASELESNQAEAMKTPADDNGLSRSLP